MDKKTIYYLKQKLVGLVLIAISVGIGFIADYNFTVALLVAPIGLFLMFTKAKVLLCDEYDFEEDQYEDEEDEEFY